MKDLCHTTSMKQKSQMRSFSIATWNINSIRFRLPLILQFLQIKKPDILCLQETKCPNAYFPTNFLNNAGYKYITFSGQKSYNGVAILGKLPFSTISKPDLCDKNDCRYITVTVNIGRKIHIHNFYIPAGGDEADPESNPQFAYKLEFLQKMKNIFNQNSYSSILTGDLNIAPLENDVWSHKKMLKTISHTLIETNSLKEIQIQGGWIDLIRNKIPEPKKIFTWWSYRSKNWKKSNRGRRIDHIWGSLDLVPYLNDIEIMQETRNWDKTSDHVPILANFTFT
ncbi:MAG: exodeoxyribonuclease III [Candidatus Tokpelaia sp. JSC161]|nr:MAG: exodeoxyribonuclease III [Candidatus Tokpelaia sp. JSC161]